MRQESSTSSWRIVGASIRGRSHEESGAPNQDVWLYDKFDDVQVLAVADGAGSRERSEIGARLAAKSAVETARSALVARRWTNTSVRIWADNCMEEFDRRLDEEIEARTQELPGLSDRPSIPARDRDQYASTLIAVAWRGSTYAFFAVGDSFLVVDRKPGGPFLLSSSEYRENTAATVFVTSRNRELQTQVDLLTDVGVRGIALCSDGLAEPLLTLSRTTLDQFVFAAPPNFSRFFDVFSDRLNSDALLEDHLAAKDFSAASSDDKTMVLAVRPS